MHFRYAEMHHPAQLCTAWLTLGGRNSLPVALAAEQLVIRRKGRSLASRAAAGCPIAMPG